METKQIDDRFVIGIRTALSNSFTQNIKIITAFWKSFHHLIRRYHLQQGADYVKYGLTFRENGSLYYACTIPAKDTYPNDFEIFKIPRSTYVISTHVGPMTSLPETINHLMKESLPQQGYSIKDISLIYYECYQKGFLFEQDTSLITLGIPIHMSNPTQMLSIPAKSILQGNGQCQTGWNWFGMDYNMNLYKGCPHGCIYCDSRSACYQVDNFDIVRKKEHELEILEKELKRKKRKGVVGIGAMSDTYHPLEKTQQMTRGALKLLLRYGYGVGIDTKSDLILRDLDLLQAISKQHSCIIKLTITTADDKLCRIIEPHTALSSRRFEVLEALHQVGIFAGILCMPILPFINDTSENVKSMVALAAKHHAKFIYPGFGVTLRQNQRSYFYYQLDHHFPGKRSLYETYYHNTYSCNSLHEKELYHIFQTECERYGILYHMKDIVHAYKKDKTLEQLTLL